MTARVIALGLDAADPEWLERWMQAGVLPELDRLRRAGAYGRTESGRRVRAETVWTNFITGCGPEVSGYWSGLRFRPSGYSVDDTGAYSYEKVPPFYALGPGRKVVSFDLPQATVVDNVDGIQIVAWGAHSAMHESVSSPASLISELNQRHGPHPALNRDHATAWNPVAMRWLRGALEKGVQRRTSICLDLLAREEWDLFITAYGETHAAGHYFLHTAQEDHPIFTGKDGQVPQSNPMHSVLQHVDRSVGEIAAAAGKDTYLVVFSIHGMESNSMDLPSMVFLPELLYRMYSGGEPALAGGNGALRAPETLVPSISWPRELWSRKHGGPAFLSRLREFVPIEVTRALEAALGVKGGLDYPSAAGGLWYLPPMWYRSHWPRMKAFALPSFSDGDVRLNVRGRERDGVVDPADYVDVCNQVAAEIMQLRDARSGESIVQEVVRTRDDPFASGDNLPDADLIAIWRSRPTDVVNTGNYGRIGPVPFGRTGSHSGRGFVMLLGPGIQPGTELGTVDVADIPPTLLSLSGMPIPSTVQGSALHVAS